MHAAQALHDLINPLREYGCDALIEVLYAFFILAGIDVGCLIKSKL